MLKSSETAMCLVRMMNESKKSLQKGDNKIQVLGDNNAVNSPSANVNIFHFPISEPTLSKTKMYDLLKVFLSSQAPAESDYSLVIPAEMNEKLVFNNAPIHVEVYENHSQDLDCLMGVIRAFPDRELIVRKLRDIFLKCVHKANTDQLPTDGDACLYSVEEEVCAIIRRDKEFSLNMCSDEELEVFSTALVAYGVSKCKILVNPNEHVAS